MEESVSGVAKWDCKGKRPRGCAAETAQRLQPPQLQINSFARCRARGCCRVSEGLVARALLISSTPLRISVAKGQICSSRHK